MTNTSLSAGSIVVVPDYVLARRAAGETVLMSLESEMYFSLEGPGSRLWELIESGATFGSAVDTLFDVYEVDRAELENDMAELVNELSSNGLVVIA